MNIEINTLEAFLSKGKKYTILNSINKLKGCNIDVWMAFFLLVTIESLCACPQ